MNKGLAEKRLGDCPTLWAGLTLPYWALLQKAAAIRNTRTVLKLTQEVLAERSGLQIAAISRAERAEGSPNLRTLSRIAAALGIPVSELILQAEALLPGIQRTLSRAASQGSMKRPPRKVAAKASRQPD